jgi:hypothetical protein
MQTINSQNNQLPTQLQSMGDLIRELPSDQTVLSHNEEKIADTLFQKQKSTVDLILEKSKDILLVGILFMIFSMSQTNEFIHKFVPFSNTSEYTLIIVKTCIVMALFFILKNIHLARK